MEVVTCIAPVNIATIKYWGKRDESLILPLNDSVSVTLGIDEMHAKTTVALGPDFKSDRLWLNGKEQPVDNPRFLQLIKEIRRRSNIKNNEVTTWKVHICSENNFPTAAGLASSAAGYACLVYALAQVYKVHGNISSIARMGSGSACRSIYGGFTQWHAGTKPDGSDSFAKQLFPVEHWPELHIVILVVNDAQKKVASTSGMQQCVATSELLKHRIKECVQKHIDLMLKAIKEKNFGMFADVTMRESNQMHATCLDTFPPIVYMNDTSHAIVDFIHRYNKYHGEVKVAYTFDAGPNACLFVLENDVNELLAHVENTFPSFPGTENYTRGIPAEPKRILNMEIPSGYGEPHNPGLLKYIIHTKVGDGPSILKDPNEHLLSDNGLPTFLSTDSEKLN
ncbi:mevalonate diphosphate decarboxylase isoform X2 [Lycorma delicatula]|uniref:mevalonate diphosphate decarboxylase isoform X2 n=1 Tax=Lycorma delicatula TaxID=130591 RepID=UPI003F515587